MVHRTMKHIVGFSGGIDSQATVRWVRNRFGDANTVVLFSDAGGNENQATYRFVAQYSENIFPVTRIQPIVADMAGRNPGKIAELGLRPEDALSFDTMARIKGMFPKTHIRFCTTHLKLEPQKRWTNDNRKTVLAGGFERYIGVRRDESDGRAHVDFREYDDVFMCWLNRPLADWTKEMCFSFVKAHGETWNPLYDLGFARVGCAPCINAGKEDIRLWASRDPRMIDKIRKWEREVGYTFYASGKVPGMEINWIDDVVEWAKTKRGGRQYELPLLEADVQSGMCMNKYGFCE